MLLPDTSPFWRWQEEYRPAAFLLALSGGRDSMALLQALTLRRARLVGSGRGLGRVLPARGDGARRAV